MKDSSRKQRGTENRRSAKRISRTITMVLMVLFMIAIQAFGAPAGLSLNGSGTKEDPFRIENAVQLKELADSVNLGNSYADTYFMLTEDIDLSGICGEGEALGSWEPIGNTGDITFCGVFDGADGNGLSHTISGLYIKEGTTCYRGLFGTVTGTVKNLKVEGFVSGGDYVGGIAGMNAGNIENCSFTGTEEKQSSVTGGSFVGGIAGCSVAGSKVTDCSCNAKVEAVGTGVGGIAGWINGIPEANGLETAMENPGNLASGNSTVSGCTFSGTVTYTGESNADSLYDSANKEFQLSIQNSMYGGIAGAVTGGHLIDCKNNGTVTGDVCTGGIAGLIRSSEAAGCINTGSVEGKLLSGGLSGYLMEGTLKQCRNGEEGDSTCQVTGENLTGGLAGCMDEKSIMETSKEGGDSVLNRNYGKVVAVGEMTGGIAGLSKASIEGVDNKGAVFGGDYVGGVVGYARQTVMDCTHSGDVSGNRFVGGSVGLAKETVKDCKKTAGAITGSTYVGGVAGYAEGGIFACTTEKDGKVSGKNAPSYIGGIAGFARKAEECVNKCSVEATGDYVGGIAAVISGVVSGCKNQAQVTGNSYTGGIAGKVSESISDCKNSGSVSYRSGGGLNRGGIVGLADGSVTDCENSGSVSGTGNVGGIAGNAKGSITACRNTRQVGGGSSSENYGGIAGITDHPIADCINSGNVYGYASCGGIAGSSCSIIKNSKNTATVKVTSGNFKYTGGIVGSQTGGQVEFCNNEGFVQGTYYVGGIAGLSTGAQIVGCNNTETAEVALIGGSQEVSGGIAGHVNGSSTVDSCSNAGKVTGGTHTGGIAGVCNEDSRIIRCTQTGSVEGNGPNTGGIAGSLDAAGEDDESAIDACINQGEVKGADIRTGGITGWCAGKIINCTNNADIASKKKFTGGISGTIEKTGGATGCVNNGKISFISEIHAEPNKDQTGGIVGYISGAVIGCINNGEVTCIGGHKRTGGIAGDCNGGKIIRCTNTAPVSSDVNHTGGIAGLVCGEGIISDCINEESAVVKGSYCNSSVNVGNGGIVGMISDGSTVENCVNKALVTRHPEPNTLVQQGMYSSISAVLGGIAGAAARGTIKNCTNYGRVDGAYTGGIIAVDEGTSIINCTNNGEVNGKMGYTGGIAGSARSCSAKIKVYGCINNGNVTTVSETFEVLTGGILGVAYCEVHHCINNGEINGSGSSYTGGIVGQLQKSDLTDCLNNGKVRGLQYVGGIVGNFYAGEDDEHAIKRCGNTGTIYGDIENKNVYDSQAGGILGCADGSNLTLTISDCYNAGAVYGKTTSGGIFGKSEAKTTVLEHCYCKAPEKGTDWDGYGINGGNGATVGALYGSALDITMERNYWWSPCADYAIGGKKVSAVHIGSDYDYYHYESRFADQDNFKKWDFTNIWEIRNGSPHLRLETGNNADGVPGSTEDTVNIGGWGNDAQDSGIVKISTAEELIAFGEAVNGGKTYEGITVLLCEDIDLYGKLFIPIGYCDNDDPYNSAARHPFCGTFDGQGHSITRLDVSIGEAPAGLFGCLGDGAHLKNLSVTGSVTSKAAFVGGIAGYCGDNSVIENCSFVGTVHGTGTYLDSLVGGIAGVHYGTADGCFINCYHEGDVTADAGYAGGIAGEARNLSYCLHYNGTVKGGKTKQMTVQGESVFYNGGHRPAGGVVGRSGRPDLIRYCFCEGASAADGKLVGYESSAQVVNHEINKAYWDREAFKKQSSFQNRWLEGFDFRNVWGMGEKHPLLLGLSNMVILDPNGGEQDAQVFLFEKNGILPENSSTKSGCIFNGWNTRKDGTGNSYGEKAQVDKAMTLYAQWSPDPDTEYTVSFCGNGGIGQMEGISAKNGVTVALPEGDAVLYDRTGYDFAGWNTKADGSGTGYAAGNEYVVNGNETLYAQWEARSFHISFSWEGKTVGQDIPAGSFPVYKEDAPQKPDEGGKSFVFTGWTPRFTTVNETAGYTAVFCEKELTQSHAVTVNGGTAVAGGGTVAGSIMADEKESVIIQADEPGMGRSFDHWESDDVTVGNVTAATTRFTMPAQDVSILAVYKYASYAVTLDADGGEIKEGNLSKYTFGTGAVLPANVKKDGYIFEGWYDGETKVLEIGQADIGEKSFTAHWKKEEQYVKINPGDGSQVDVNCNAKQTTDSSMDVVVVLAGSDYYFPDDYENQINEMTRESGVTVTRTSPTQITISGDPTKDVILDLPPAVKKTNEVMPQVGFEVNSENSGVLSGLEDGAEYMLIFRDGEGNISDSYAPKSFLAEGETQAVTGITAGTLSIIKKSTDPATKNNSIAQTFSISAGMIMEAPVGSDCSSKQAADGTISGVNPSLEYKAEGDSEWSAVPADTDTISGLAPGTYQVRAKAVDTTLPSSSVEIVIRAAISPVVTIAGWTYKETPKATSVTGIPDGAKATCYYAEKGKENYDVEVPENAGDYTVKAVVGMTGIYAGATASADFTIKKAVPDYTKPADQKITCNQTLSDVALTDGFTFAKEDQELVSGNNTVKLIYTPSDTDNYEVVKDIEILVTIEGHKLTKTNAKAATCTEAGNSAYWTCSDCHKYFYDAEGKNEIEKDAWIIAATGQDQKESGVIPQAGTLLVDDKRQSEYKITSADPAKPAVVYTANKDKAQTAVTIPSEVVIGGTAYKVEAIEDNAFRNDTTVKQVIIGNNVKEIGKSAFAGCTNLKNVKLNSALESIGDQAFANCKAVTKIIIPKNVRKIGKYAFKGNPKLKTIIVKTMKLTKKSVSKKAFSGVGKNVVIKIPKSKKKAYEKLFRQKGLSKKVQIK